MPGPQAAPGGAPDAETGHARQTRPSAERRRERKPDAPKADRRRVNQSARDSGERGLRDLVGAGHSQLGVSGALRGRDVNRPTEDDLAEAEREVQIVRRNWSPPAERSQRQG